jgi:hypothetical protein
MGEIPQSDHEMKLLILRTIDGSTRHHAHKHILLGRGEQQGDLERFLDVKFERETRVLADRAFESLKASGLIASTHEDVVAPDMWVELTAAGKLALASGTLDDVDRALMTLSPHLVELRQGAHVAAASTGPDAARQAAHSARELIDQVLRHAATDEQVRAMPWFKPDPTASSGITRRHRARAILERTHGRTSETDTDYVDAAIQLILATDRMLMARAHEEGIPDRDRVESLIRQLDGVLQMLLVRGSV